MVCACSVPGCGNESGLKESLRMHRFPFHNKELIQKWINAICRPNWYPSRNCKICGDHFVPDDYISLDSNRLKSSAVPSLLLPVVVECHHEEESPNLLKEALMNNNKVKVMDNITIMKESVVPQICSCVDGQHSVAKPVRIGFRKRPRVLTLSQILSKPSTSRHGLVQGDLVDIETAIPAATILNASKNKTSENLKTSFLQSNNSSTSSSSSVSKDDEDIQVLAMKLTNLCIEKSPKMYVGISKAWYESGFINLLSQKSKLPARDVTLALMKIRLNDSFERLGHMFGTSERVANTIFYNSVNRLGDLLNEVIRWPDEDAIIKLLPIPFRFKFSNVKSILTCLEIEISQPVDRGQQHAATWSKYSKCNLIKYLVASTPDGFIHFVSRGFDGSFTDADMLAQSTRFIDLLPDGCAILTEKRFEHLLSLIKNKSCELIILPSVSSTSTGTRATKEQILFNKSIKSLRIYFDRLISQMRQYEIVKLRSVVDSNLIPILDNIVVIIAALVNLQSPLLKD